MPIPVLKTQYLDTIVPAMMKSRGYTNKHQVPSVEKVVLNSNYRNININLYMDNGMVIAWTIIIGVIAEEWKKFTL